jgi:PAS domain S-box-containing protein
MEISYGNLNAWLEIASAKVKSSLSIAYEYVDGFLGLAQKRLMQLGSRARREHDRLQEMLRERERSLSTLLASTMDAVVVTDDSHRFLAANQTALTLFGVSRKNINNFTIDAFLPFDQISLSQRGSIPFMRRFERRGKCEIRRLDGTTRFAEFTFHAHFSSGRHLSKFHDITSQRRANLYEHFSVYDVEETPRRYSDSKF